ncbi:NAD-dependent epimerase/dehydratase family protein [Alkalicella caledoniensis]|uniref:NAD-dependent epimerase/dehydratase family protein n=1 Tax=Alkalicella caledoniensis TaxID=2731377 RepID=A0A7G9WDF1_ALKCA|nr:NAD-dependent epimerase/dehydratase family protein [Alkalicella caledoniensis]
MKILVMGGTEFVSSSMAKYLISKGYTVDVFTRGIKPLNYEGLRKHLKGDRKSTLDLKANIGNEKYHYVFDISAYTKEDVEKLTNVLDRESLKRYVFCSSGAVYIPSDEMVSEDFAKGENANWGAYGLGKKEAEDYLFKLWGDDKFPMTIFRPTYIYGEDNNLLREKYLFNRISKSLDVPIPDGDKKNQFIYISDLVRILESAIHTEKSAGQAYNATHPQLVTWEKLVQAAIKAVNIEVKIKKIDSKREDVKLGEYFIFRNINYILSLEKAQKDGLYVPKIDIQEGMKLAYKWYCEAKPEVNNPRMTKVDYVLES